MGMINAGLKRKKIWAKDKSAVSEHGKSLSDRLSLNCKMSSAKHKTL